MGDYLEDTDSLLLLNKKMNRDDHTVTKNFHRNSSLKRLNTKHFSFQNK
jgi:hypothetical protein